MSTASNGTQPSRQNENEREEDESSESDLSDEWVTLETPMHGETVQQRPREAEPQSNISQDTESLLSDRGEEVRSKLLNDIKKNWKIHDLVDMFADKTWLRGVDQNPAWKLRTLKDFHELSEMTKDKARSVKVELGLMWSIRDHGHYYYTLAVGKDWKTKEPRIREDLQTLLKQLGGDGGKGARDRKGGTTIKNGVLPCEAEVDEALNLLKRRKTQATASTGVGRRTRSKRGNLGDAADTEGDNSNDDNESRTIVLRRSDIDPIADRETLKLQIFRYWRLKSRNCTDALPDDLRPKGHKKDGAWVGAIHSWGLPSQDVLKRVCELASITQGRHEDVVKRLRDLIRAKPKATGVGLEELTEVYESFERERNNAAIRSGNGEDADGGGDSMNGGEEGEAGIESNDQAAPPRPPRKEVPAMSRTQMAVRQLAPVQKKVLEQAGRKLEKAVAILREKEQRVNVAKDERDVVFTSMESTPDQRAQAQKVVGDMEMQVRRASRRIRKLSDDRQRIAKGEEPSDDEADDELGA